MQNYPLIGAGPPPLGDQAGPQNLSVSAALGASVDDYAPSGYVSGYTGRLRLTPAGGGSTINGLGASYDGYSVLIVNDSAVDSITFAHQAGSSASANRFNLPNAASAVLAPLAAAWCVYVKDSWRFA